MKPTTYMNLSGEAVKSLAKFYKIPTSNVLAVYDELDLPFGQIKTRIGGGSAGHKGVKSLIQHLGEGFGRIRIGTANDDSASKKSEDFVLAKFDKSEVEQMPALVAETTDILLTYCHSGKLSEETRRIIN